SSAAATRRITPSSTSTATPARAGPPVPSTSRTPASHSRSAPGAGAAISAGNRCGMPVPPRPAQAEGWFDYGWIFLYHAESDPEDCLPAYNRALEIAEASGATALVPRVLAGLAVNVLLRGEVEEGLAFLERGWALAQAAGDGTALAWLV